MVSRNPAGENHKAHSRKRGSSPSTDGWDVAVVWVDGLGLAARSTEHARAWRAISRGSRTSGLVPAALVARVAFCRSRPNSTDGGYASFTSVSPVSLGALRRVRLASLILSLMESAHPAATPEPPQGTVGCGGWEQQKRK